MPAGFEWKKLEDRINSFKSEKDKVTGIGDFLFIFDKEYLKGAKDPLEAIKRFLAVKQKAEEEQDIFQ